MKPSLDVYNRIPHIADAVSYINKLKKTQVLKLIPQLSHFQLIELLDNPELKYAVDIASHLTKIGNADVLDHVAEDRMVVLLNEMDPELRQQTLNLLSQTSRASILRLMSFPENSAGSIMTTEFIQVPTTWSVGRTLAHIKEVESTRETVYAIYVIDEEKKLRFVLPLRKLVCADTDLPLTDLWASDQSPITIDPYADRKDVARLIRRHDFLALPIVDDGQIIGIVTVDDVIDALIDEASEDLGRFGGGEHIDQPYLDVSFKTMLRKRGGFDPASASAPLVATLVDVLGLIIYFSTATLVLTGTVL